MNKSISKILLVDDDPAIVRLLTKWLSQKDYELSSAQDGRQAQAAISADCPDIVITDWDMPYIDGMELCHWIRGTDLQKYVYVLFLSARCGSHDMIRALEAGADDFLKKPIDKSELLARIRAGTRVLNLEGRLTLLAKTDPLTGLDTQRTFYQSLDVECGLASRQNLPLSCVKIDIDRFQRINDVHGHHVGDDVIRRIGRTILTGCRSNDVVARYAGEEFCVLLPDTTEDGAVLWADRIRNAIGSLEFAVDRECLRVTASCGVAQYSPDMEVNPERLVQTADEALLVAKGSGRDRVVGFQSLTQTGMESADADLSSTFGKVPASHVMTTVVASLNKKMLIAQAANYFLRFRIPSAPVVDDTGQLVGVLSERDVMGVMLWPDWANTRVEQVMKTNVITYEESTPAMQIYEFLCRVSIRAVVIVDEGRPTGVLSRSSLVRWFTNALVADRRRIDESRSQVLEASPRELVSNIAFAIRQQADLLTNELPQEEDFAATAVVAGASRVQELANDLLAASPTLRKSIATPV